MASSRRTADEAAVRTERPLGVRPRWLSTGLARSATAIGSSSTTCARTLPRPGCWQQRRRSLTLEPCLQSRTQLTSELVTRDKEIQSRYGHFRHADMVGKPWGTKLASSNGRGFVFLLKPTPELWYVPWIPPTHVRSSAPACTDLVLWYHSPSLYRTQALPHRTQILYLPDIAFISSYLDVKAGSQVIEAGRFHAGRELERKSGRDGRTDDASWGTVVRYRLRILFALPCSNGGGPRQST